MSVSHTSTLALPPLQAHPHTRLATARAPHIRLPSYRELTSQCEVPPTAARSSLFTAGLIHLPPLRVPGATSGGSSPNANANRGREDKEYDEPHRHSAEHTEREKDKAPPRALGVASSSNGNGKRGRSEEYDEPRRRSTEHDRGADREQDHAQYHKDRRFLDITRGRRSPDQREKEQYFEDRRFSRSPYSGDSGSAGTATDGDGDEGESGASNSHVRHHHQHHHHSEPQNSWPAVRDRRREGSSSSFSSTTSAPYPAPSSSAPTGPSSGPTHGRHPNYTRPDGSTTMYTTGGTPYVSTAHNGGSTSAKAAYSELAARPHPSAYGLAAYAHPDPTSYFHNNSYNASASGNANTNGSGNGNAAVYATALALEHAAFDLTPKLKFSHAKAGGRTKKQALSCFFCRERKIACGRPEGEALGAGGQEGACNQCARRKIPCTYPTVSHRGQHSRIKSAARKAHSGGRDDGTPVRGPYLAGDDDAGGRPMAMDVDSGRRETRATRATRVAS